MKLFRHLYELWPHDLLPLIIVTVALILPDYLAVPVALFSLAFCLIMLGVFLALITGRGK